ncbi:Bgt-20575, partial [Blumeria graminis f. sp. tritici]
EKKQCAYCKRSGRIREACFKWLNTPDGSKWAAKNPEKAARTRSLKKRLQQRRHTGSEPELSSSASKSNQ